MTSGHKAVYQQQCSVNFRTNTNIPSVFSDEKLKHPVRVGKPVDEELTSSFLKVAQFLEDNDNEHITLTDLRNKMLDFLQEAGIEKEPYTEKHLRKQKRISEIPS